MILLGLSLALLGVSAVLSIFLSSSPRALRFNAISGSVAAALAGFIPAFQVLWGHDPFTVSLPWHVPYASLSLQLDALSSFFLLPVMGLPALAAIYGTGYLSPKEGVKRLHVHWMFYQLLTASMVLVLCARNAVLFLVAWEAMTLFSYFLVTFDDREESVRRAGWIYLVAAHFGTAFLIVLFLGLGARAGSFEFEAWRGMASSLPNGGFFFALALLGFGVKAGFVPLHLWLPEAHPAAPSHVSAVMSGVMIKTGIYGLLRTLEFIGPPAPLWGWSLVVVGATSGILGVLFALAQHDLKRLLAYHSVENIGIIALGMGMGLLGISYGRTDLAVLGFAGALLHVVNHALFKGLLFLGAGAVLHSTGTAELDRLGGLAKRMPATAAFFFVGAVAISGLPPLNGFVSEFLIYLGAFRGVGQGTADLALAGVMVLVSLALIGGLAAACFTKAFGTVFLGEPREVFSHPPHESPRSMTIPMGVLASACVLIGLASPLILPYLGPVLADLVGGPQVRVDVVLSMTTGILWLWTAVALLAVLMIALFYAAKAFDLRRRTAEPVGTWDCGYAAPTARMQYTASSFAENFTTLFAGVLRTHTRVKKPDGIFPKEASFHSETPDPFLSALYRPLLHVVERFRNRWKTFQQGRIQVYLLYIAVTLLGLLVWGWINL